jgi:hypothetical protein
MENKTKKQIWYEKNKKRIAEQNKIKYQKNKEQIIAKVKEYKKLNPDIEKRSYDKNKETRLEKQKKYGEKNKERIKQYKKEYQQKNKERLNQISNEYRLTNKKLINEKIKNRVKSDPMYALTVSIRKNILKAFRKRTFEKTSSTKDILGCTFEELKQYIESKFKPWMNWDNRGLYNGEPEYGWDIDHIIPLDTAKTVEDIVKLNHYSNLQPLCSYYNRDIKRAKLL